MKSLLFFLLCMLLAVYSFGQNYEPNKNAGGKVNNNVNTNNSLEEIKLEVPVKETKKVVEKAKSEVQTDKSQKKSPVVSEEHSNATALGSRFSSAKKIAATQLTSRSPSLIQQKEMDEVISYYKTNAPESFEYHYFKYVAGNYDVSLVSHLKKAKELRPSNSDVIMQLAAYHTITGETATAAKELQQLVEMKKLTADVLSYTADLLNSVPQNGYLLTHGFDDGFGSLYMISVRNVRSDVKIISLDFMQSKFYRDRLQKEGFTMPSSTVIDVAFLNEFCKKNVDKKLFLSMTFPKPYLTGMADQLYVHGLVFAYGKNGAALLDDNELIWTKLLSVGSVYKTQTEKGKQLSANYLPMLFYLRNKYELQSRKKDLIEIDKAIDRIGMQSNRLSNVNSMRGRK